MKKNFKKAFTLVEMLIVVVIIGILSSALLPRLQGAQSAARDAARKSDLSQLGSAIISYYNNRWDYPWSWTRTDWSMIPADTVGKLLIDVVELSSVPSDPNRSNSFTFWDKTIWSWQYGYMLANKNSIPNGGFVLMARVETEGWANYLSWLDGLSWDLKNFKACTKFEFLEGDATTVSLDKATWLCKYKNKSDLRYVYTF